jgi:hypothetical protein
LIEVGRTASNSIELEHPKKRENNRENATNYEEWSKSIELDRTLTPEFVVAELKRMKSPRAYAARLTWPTRKQYSYSEPIFRRAGTGCVGPRAYAARLTTEERWDSNSGELERTF